MKKISKIMIGTSVAIATVIPSTIALTSCGDNMVYFNGKNKDVHIPKNTSKYTTVTFEMAKTITANPISYTFKVDDAYKDKCWFECFKKEVKNFNIVFYFKDVNGSEKQWPPIYGSFTIVMPGSGSTGKSYTFNHFYFTSDDTPAGV